MTPLPQTAVIVGASRGVGNAIAKQLLERGCDTVFCASRDAVRATGLAALRKDFGDRVVPVDLDITNDDSVAEAASNVATHTEQVDWVVNTAGLLHDGELQPERRLADIQSSNLLRLFAVNSVGPLLLARYFAPLLPRQETCVVASLSARVGSIGDNRLGGWYGYRASKAAQNMLIRTLSIELRRRYKRVRCVALHPGTVETDLSAPFRGGVAEKKLFSPATSADYLLKVLEQLNDDDNGKFFAWDGQEIPW
ncbi:MAG: SDR family oxidoreductase [Pseudomonadota bacterium]